MAARTRVPSYRHHKGTDQAVVTLRGRDFYLGKHGTPASREKYRQLLAEYLAGRPLPGEVGADGPSIAEVLVLYTKHANGYYRKNGRPTSEVTSIRAALRFVTDNFGTKPAAEFDILALRAVREAIIDAGHCRSVVNQNVGKIVRAFRWATTESLYPGNLLAEIQALPGLRKGRTRAHETKPVLPVADEVVDATVAVMEPVTTAMVKLQRATGMRPDEVCSIRPVDIDRTGEVWIYIPHEHKTEHHGKVRLVHIGPKGQGILRPFLLRPEAEYCFRPTRAAAIPRAVRRYTISGYRNAVRRAAKKAGVEHWSPNRLRHTFATEARKAYGLEAAQVLLGHASADITQVYAERDTAKAVEVAKAIG